MSFNSFEGGRACNESWRFLNNKTHTYLSFFHTISPFSGFFLQKFDFYFHWLHILLIFVILFEIAFQSQIILKAIIFNFLDVCLDFLFLYVHWVWIFCHLFLLCISFLIVVFLNNVSRLSYAFLTFLRATMKYVIILAKLRGTCTTKLNLRWAMARPITICTIR